MPEPTPTQRLADLLLGVPLGEFVATRRSAKRSWRLIALDLRDETDGEIDVTPQTLQNWYGSETAGAA